MDFPPKYYILSFSFTLNSETGTTTITIRNAADNIRNKALTPSYEFADPDYIFENHTFYPFYLNQLGYFLHFPFSPIPILLLSFPLPSYFPLPFIISQFTSLLSRSPTPHIERYAFYVCKIFKLSYLLFFPSITYLLPILPCITILIKGGGQRNKKIGTQRLLTSYERFKSWCELRVGSSKRQQKENNIFR